MSFPLPSPHWQWHIEPHEAFLCLSLGEQGTLKTGLNRKNIRDVSGNFGGFSVSDTEIYNHFYEKIENSALCQDLRFAFIILINSIAVKQFHKEIAAKNWYFNPGAKVHMLQISPLMSVETKQDVADVLVINVGEDFSSCMLLQDLQVNDTKTLSCFSLIKLGNERLFDFTAKCLNAPAQHN